MKIYCRGTAAIRHIETGEVHEIDCDDLDWEAVGSNDRQMGDETHYEAKIEHPEELGIVTWGLWEYPIGVENDQNTDVGEHEIIKDFDYGLEHETPTPDDWLYYDAPDNPYTIFLNSFNHTGGIMAGYEKGHEDFLLNRMVFSHQITALEAYLGDTLINEVMGDADAMQRLVLQADELVKRKFTLAEIAKSPDLVRDTVRTYLRTILYHNLAKVDVLYKIALGFGILSLAAEKMNLFKAVSLRHDCVHRNGFDKDGNELKMITKEFVQETADLIRDFVDEIENAVASR